MFRNLLFLLDFVIFWNCFNDGCEELSWKVRSAEAILQWRLCQTNLSAEKPRLIVFFLSSGLYSQYAVDDSAIPNPRSSYHMNDSGDNNPYRAPYATEEQNGLSMMKHLSKSEPDIAPSGDVRIFLFLNF